MRRIKLWIPSIIWAIFIFYLSNQPGSNLPKSGIFAVEGIDRIGHFLEFFIFALLAAYGIENDRKNLGLLKKIWFLILISSLYALSDEVHQIPISERFFDIIDLIVDISGVVTFVIIYIFVKLAKGFKISKGLSN